MDYAEFGRNFVARAITPGRLAGVIADIAGQRIEVGPLAAGPAGAATARAVGRVGQVGAGRLADDTFEATIPVDLDLTVRLAGRSHRYKATSTIPLRISVTLEAPMTLLLDVHTVRARDVQADVRWSGVAAGIIGQLGDIRREVARHIARYVNERAIASADLRRIDIGRMIDELWDSELRDRFLIP
jgi:hypothetical protein